MATLLLVEDHEMSRDMLARRLQRRGYQVLVAADCEEGVARARADRPDLVLMDLALPGDEGCEAARRLRGLPETRLTPVIALSAHTMPADRRRAIEAGCDDFEPKPVELDRLLRKIGALLAAAAPGRASLRVPAVRESLAKVRDWLEARAADAGLGEDDRFALVLAADEACANVVVHGGQRPQAHLEVGFQRTGAEACVTVSDQGPPFDPASLPAPDLDSAAESRRVGGLGWHFIRSVIDDVRYVPDAAHGNRLTLVRRVGARDRTTS